MSDTVALKYVEAGQGTPVVLLHGFPLNGAIWRDQVTVLSTQYRVIVPDLRGHGGSPAPAGVYEMGLMARDVFALLDTLGVTKAVFLGHSMGGYVALAGLKLAPERYLGLGLVASQTGADTEEGKQGRFKTADKVAAEGAKVVADAIGAKVFAPDLSPDSPIVAQVRQIMLATKPDGIVGTLKGMAARSDSGELLAAANLPVLILAGGKDQIIPIAKAQAIAASVKTATLATLDGAGHMPMLEQPEATTKAIQEFLKKV